MAELLTFCQWAHACNMRRSIVQSFFPTCIFVLLSLMNSPPSFMKQTLIISLNLFSSKFSDRFWGSPSLPFRGVKRPGCEFEHVCPFNAQVRNEWSCTSIHRVCLHGVQTENVLFHFLKQAFTWCAAWEGRNRFILCRVVSVPAAQMICNIVRNIFISKQANCELSL